ncbi:hypothetical protein [Paenibacillus marchantiophytorum]|nr:hypothetical protein [Paenibacillus marchantiophytorum]
MLFQWIKWKFYIRWRNEWGKMTSIYVLIILLDVLKMLSYFLVSLIGFRLLIFSPAQTSEFLSSIGGGIFQGVFELVTNFNLKSKLYYVWVLLFMQLTIFSIFSGIQASKWELSSCEDLHIQNLPWNERQKKLLLYSEQMLWDIKQLITGYLPFAFALVVAAQYGLFQSLCLVVIVTITYLIQNHFVASLHNAITTRKLFSGKYKIILLLQALLCKMAIAVLGYSLGKIFSPWINAFPVIGSRVDALAYEQWLLYGKQLLFQETSYVFLVLLNENWLHTILARVAVNNSGWELWLIWMGILLLLGILLPSLNTNLLRKQSVSDGKFLEMPYLIISKWFVSASNRLIMTRIIIMCRAQQVQQRPSVLFGGLIIWGVIGLVVFFIGHTQSQKVFYLVITMCMYILIYFLSTLLFDDLSGQFSFESDGRLLPMYLANGATLWHIFTQKLQLFLIASVPMFVLIQIVFICVGNIHGFWFAILILVGQAINYTSFAVINYIPSLVCPHFNFIHIEQLDEFADKGMVKAIVRIIMLGVAIPLLMLPLAFYLSDEISEMQFLWIQMGGIPVVVLTMFFTGMWFIKRQYDRYHSLEELNI